MTVRIAVAALLVALVASLAPAAPAVAEPARPFPQHVEYRGRSIKPSQPSQQRIDRDVRRLYRHWKRTYVVAAGSDGSGRPLYRVSFGSTDPGRTVSEGQGYGMIAVAYMAGADPDAQSLFDGMWRWARRYPSSIDPRLMAFEVPPGDGDSAFDGDADMAYALLLADAQWGGTGAIDYGRDARRLIGAIRRSTIGPDSRLPLLGDWVDPESTGRYNQSTWRPSDCMSGHFRAFARVAGQRFWRSVARRCVRQIARLQQTQAPVTGLVPDFAIDAGARPHPAPPNFLEGPDDGSYSYNAFRVPWRVGVDALVNGRRSSRVVVARTARWFAREAGGRPAVIGAGYRLSGDPIPGSGYLTSVVLAPLAVATMSTTNRQRWLDSLYGAVRNRREDYYEDSVTLLSLVVVSQNWWDPTRPP